MIVSGGKILATAKVKTDGTTVSGDGLYDPIGLVDVSRTVSYDVSADSDNVHITRTEDAENNKIAFGVSVDKTDYKGSDYIGIDEDRTLTVNQSLIDSASLGNQAFDTVLNNSAKWNDKSSVYTAGPNISIMDNTISGRDWSPELDKISTSAADLSAYIDNKEDTWENSAYEVTTSTPDTLDVRTEYDETDRKITVTLSANGRTYEAGDWIDKTKLDDGVISVSGYRNLKVQEPLYFSADEVDENTTWLLYSGDDSKQTKTAIAICNGWNGEPNSYYTNNAGISASIPSKSLAAEYAFHFERAMTVQLEANAKFISKSDTSDKIGVVGFGAATIGDTKLTNDKTYTMFGCQGEQYFATSTIIQVNTTATDGVFPTNGLDVKMKFVYDTDFLDSIEYPYVAIRELVDEV